MMRVQYTALAAVTAALVLGTLLTACGTGDAIGSDGRVDAGTPGAVIEVVEGVEYYPACGNELLTLGDTTWYPFTPTDPAALPSAGGLGGGMARIVSPRIVLPGVAAPGPGDAVGTVTVFEGGLAHFVSDSGNLQTWLTDQALTYGWVC